MRWGWLITMNALLGYALACDAERTTATNGLSSEPGRAEAVAYGRSDGEQAESTVEPPVLVVGEIDPETGFAANAFPPAMPDREWHHNAWFDQDCLRCHETGVESAPVIRHEGLPAITLEARCRSCHVLIPGLEPSVEASAPLEEESEFLAGAFPPMIPNSPLHTNAWMIEDCLMCHEDGTKGAPIVRHEGLPDILMDVKCRTCHVQVRAIDADPEPV